MRKRLTLLSLLAMILSAPLWSFGQTTPVSGDVVFTHASSDDDIIEFITLKRLNLSNLDITDNGICSNTLFRRAEDSYSFTLTDVPAGTFVRVSDAGGANETNTNDGIVTFNGTGVTQSTSGDQAIVFVGTAQGANNACGGSGTNTYIAGLNHANAGWITTGTPNDNSSYAPGTTSDFHVGGLDNYQINPATALSGNAATLRTAMLTAGNWQGSDNLYTTFTLKNIQFNQSDYSSGAIGATGTSTTATIDCSALVFSGTTTDTRYAVVIRQGGTPSVPADRYTCYGAITTDFTTSNLVVTSVATPPCTTPTNSANNTRIVYFGYGLPSALTITALTSSASYTVNVYAVNGNGYSANFGTAATTTFTVSSSLPVELASFTAEAISSREVRLDWATIHEIDNDYVVVERSIDGREFDAIGQVDGAGTSDRFNTYTFTDGQAQPGRSYYRLRQVDFNGQSTIFPAIEAFVPVQASHWKLYPQPASHSLTLTPGQGGAFDSEIEILNLQGQVMQKQSVAAGTSEVLMDISTLATGMYLVRVTEQGNSQIVRMIKQ